MLCTSTISSFLFHLLYPLFLFQPGHLSTRCWSEERRSRWVWWWLHGSSALWMGSCRDTTCCTVLSSVMTGRLTIALKLVGTSFAHYLLIKETLLHQWRAVRGRQVRPRITITSLWKQFASWNWLFRICANCEEDIETFFLELICCYEWESKFK